MYYYEYNRNINALTGFRGVWLRMRGDILDQQGADRLGYQLRLILNWERDLL